MISDSLRAKGLIVGLPTVGKSSAYHPRGLVDLDDVRTSIRADFWSARAEDPANVEAAEYAARAEFASLYVASNRFSGPIFLTNTWSREFLQAFGLAKWPLAVIRPPDDLVYHFNRRAPHQPLTHDTAERWVAGYHKAARERGIAVLVTLDRDEFLQDIFTLQSRD